MRRIVVQAMCSVCYGLDRTEVQADFDGVIKWNSTEREIQLCATHMREPINLLLDWLIQYGDKVQPVDKPVRTTRAKAPSLPVQAPAHLPARQGATSKTGIARVPCEYCNGLAAPGVGMALHIKSKHPAYWAGPVKPTYPRKSTSKTNHGK